MISYGIQFEELVQHGIITPVSESDELPITSPVFLKLRAVSMPIKRNHIVFGFVAIVVFSVHKTEDLI